MSKSVGSSSKSDKKDSLYILTGWNQVQEGQGRVQKITGADFVKAMWHQAADRREVKIKAVQEVSSSET